MTGPIGTYSNSSGFSIYRPFNIAGSFPTGSGLVRKQVGSIAADTAQELLASTVTEAGPLLADVASETLQASVNTGGQEVLSAAVEAAQELAANTMHEAGSLVTNIANEVSQLPVSAEVAGEIVQSSAPMISGGVGSAAPFYQRMMSRISWIRSPMGLAIITTVALVALSAYFVYRYLYRNRLSNPGAEELQKTEILAVSDVNGSSTVKTEGMQILPLTEKTEPVSCDVLAEPGGRDLLLSQPKNKDSVLTNLDWVLGSVLTVILGWNFWGYRATQQSTSSDQPRKEGQPLQLEPSSSGEIMFLPLREEPKLLTSGEREGGLRQWQVLSNIKTLFSPPSEEPKLFASAEEAEDKGVVSIQEESPSRAETLFLPVRENPKLLTSGGKDSNLRQWQVLSSIKTLFSPPSEEPKFFTSAQEAEEKSEISPQAQSSSRVETMFLPLREVFKLLTSGENNKGNAENASKVESPPRAERMLTSNGNDSKPSTSGLNEGRIVENSPQQQGSSHGKTTISPPGEDGKGVGVVENKGSAKVIKVRDGLTHSLEEKSLAAPTQKSPNVSSIKQSSLRLILRNFKARVGGSSLFKVGLLFGFAAWFSRRKKFGHQEQNREQFLPFETQKNGVNSEGKIRNKSDAGEVFRKPFSSAYLAQTRSGLLSFAQAQTNPQMEIEPKGMTRTNQDMKEISNHSPNLIRDDLRTQFTPEVTIRATQTATQSKVVHGETQVDPVIRQDSGTQVTPGVTIRATQTATESKVVHGETQVDPVIRAGLLFGFAAWVLRRKQSENQEENQELSPSFDTQKKDVNSELKVRSKSEVRDFVRIPVSSAYLAQTRSGLLSFAQAQTNPQMEIEPKGMTRTNQDMKEISNHSPNLIRDDLRTQFTPEVTIRATQTATESKVVARGTSPIRLSRSSGETQVDPVIRKDSTTQINPVGTIQSTQTASEKTVVSRETSPIPFSLTTVDKEIQSGNVRQFITPAPLSPRRVPLNEDLSRSSRSSIFVDSAHDRRHTTPPRPRPMEKVEMPMPFPSSDNVETARTSPGLFTPRREGIARSTQTTPVSPPLQNLPGELPQPDPLALTLNLERSPSPGNSLPPNLGRSPSPVDPLATSRHARERPPAAGRPSGETPPPQSYTPLPSSASQGSAASQQTGIPRTTASFKSIPSSTSRWQNIKSRYDENHPTKSLPEDMKDMISNRQIAFVLEGDRYNKTRKNLYGKIIKAMEDRPHKKYNGQYWVNINVADDVLERARELNRREGRLK